MCSDTQMTTLKEQAEPFLASLATRRRNPVKPATIKAYSSYLRNWIIPRIGKQELASFENGAMRQFVSYLVDKKLSPAMIGSIVTATKALIRSEIDANGNILNPREWNQDFIDMPAVRPEEQDAPIIDATALSKAIRNASGQFQSLYALQAGSGLRISEVLALKMGPDDGVSSIWDPETAIIHVRRAIYDRQEQGTKSAAGVREVDIYSKLNSWLADRIKRAPGEYLWQTRNETLRHVATIYDHLEKDGIPGTHSLRRFRATHLDNTGVTEALIKFWLGHAGKSVSDRYTKVLKFTDHRRGWCERAGLGFELPQGVKNDSETTNQGIEEVSTGNGSDSGRSQDQSNADLGSQP